MVRRKYTDPAPKGPLLGSLRRPAARELEVALLALFWDRSQSDLIATSGQSVGTSTVTREDAQGQNSSDRGEGVAGSSEGTGCTVGNYRTSPLSAKRLGPDVVAPKPKAKAASTRRGTGVKDEEWDRAEGPAATGKGKGRVTLKVKDEPVGKGEKRQPRPRAAYGMASEPRELPPSMNVGSPVAGPSRVTRASAATERAGPGERHVRDAILIPEEDIVGALSSLTRLSSAARVAQLGLAEFAQAAADAKVGLGRIMKPGPPDGL
ncbi:hypothetical protein DFH11DRAFT_1729121 [Phellopilus nigrolimitatus]|nr:hypothetical protein DFH11DRAFT_1729121 [Phellopilus nigrolimitatus]